MMYYLNDDTVVKLTFNRVLLFRRIKYYRHTQSLCNKFKHKISATCIQMFVFNDHRSLFLIQMLRFKLCYNDSMCPSTIEVVRCTRGRQVPWGSEKMLSVYTMGGCTGDDGGNSPPPNLKLTNEKM